MKEYIDEELKNSTRKKRSRDAKQEIKDLVTKHPGSSAYDLTNHFLKANKQTRDVSSKEFGQNYRRICNILKKMRTANEIKFEIAESDAPLKKYVYRM